MQKNLAQSFLMLFLLTIGLCCMADSNDENKIGDKSMGFEINDIAYPVWMGNLQRNSFVPVEMKSKWKPLWSKMYIEINENLVLTPYATLVHENRIGVTSGNDLIIYSSDGTFQSQTPLNSAAGVLFGKNLFSYLNPSYQLTAMDYEGNQFGLDESIPFLSDWAGAIYILPGLDKVQAVVQFSGGPMREPQKYYIYNYLWEDDDFDWINEFDGRISFAMPSNDNDRIIIIKDSEVVIFNSKDGKNSGSFNFEIGTVLTASLDLNDNLLLLSEQTKENTTKRAYRAFDLEGNILWSYDVTEPSENQPAACGSDGRVYIIDGIQLICLEKGTTKWTTLLKPAEKNWLTVTADNHAVVINGSLLALFAPDGEKIFERLITKTDEQFYAPPALDKEGHIFVAGQKALYCFE